MLTMDATLPEKDYLTVQQAARYIGVSAQTLRRWDAEGKLKSVRQPGNDYRYNKRLREPQRQAHKHVREHFEERVEPAIIQIPVGCGKTGIIATLPFGISQGRVLVIAPNTTIRRGIAEAIETGHPKFFLGKTSVLSSFSAGPFVAVLDGP